MTRTIAAAVQFIKDNGIHYADGECERIVNNAGGFTHAYGLARLSMEASPVSLNPDYSAAPDGMLHYWSGAWGTWGSYGYTDAGHVMFGYQGLLWGDSGAITGHYNNARFAGSVSKADLERKYTNLHYLGWTPYHGPETLADVSTASVGPTTSIDNGDDMYDAAAEARLMAALQTAAAPFKAYQVGSGIIIVNPQTGKGWAVPSQAYFTLVQALGLAGAVTRVSTTDEQAFIASLATTLDLTAAVGPVVLSDADVAKIVAGMPASTSFDPAPILAAIQAGDTSILNAIAAQPADTLAAFGLKRI